MDGIDHINVYSKGKTELGRLLSNFADTPFEIENIGRFQTVEGYWYWIITGDDWFKEALGWEAKKFGKEAPKVRDHPTYDELTLAYLAKLRHNPRVKELLETNTLPLKHYYVYGNKVVEPKEWQWTAELWNELV